MQNFWRYENNTWLFLEYTKNKQINSYRKWGRFECASVPVFWQGFQRTHPWWANPIFLHKWTWKSEVVAAGFQKVGSENSILARREWRSAHPRPSFSTTKSRSHKSMDCLKRYRLYMICVHSSHMYKLGQSGGCSFWTYVRVKKQTYDQIPRIARQSSRIQTCLGNILT